MSNEAQEKENISLSSLQERILPQLDQLKHASEKVQQQLSKQLEKARAEGDKVLLELGVNLQEADSLSDTIEQLRTHNPDINTLIKNINIATYDSRFSYRWNRRMVPAFAKLQANKAYNRNVKPRVEELKVQLGEQVQELNERANELKEKVLARRAS